MAVRIADRVKETTTTTGTGTIELGGALSGFQTFVAGIGSGNTCYYCIAGATEWEIGIGTVTDASPDTLSRTMVLSSSNSGSLVSFSSGTKNVFCTLPTGGIGSQILPVWTGTNYTSGRAVNTVYQNTSGYWMVVMVHVVVNSDTTLQAFTDSSNPPTTQVATHTALNTWDSTLIFLVANNDYYKITGAVGSIPVWSEYLIVKGTISQSSELHASRAIDTAYQNTSGTLMLVSLQIGTSGGIKVFTDASNPPTTEILDTQMVSAGGVLHGTVLFPVLPGEYYKISSYTGSPTIDLLYEYTWSGVGAQRSVSLLTLRESLPTTDPVIGNRLYMNTTGRSLFVIISGTIANVNPRIWMDQQAKSRSGFSIPLAARIQTTALRPCVQTNTNGLPIAAYSLVNPYETYGPWGSNTLTGIGWYEWKIASPPSA